jgi:hypothetical protein
LLAALTHSLLLRDQLLADLAVLRAASAEVSNAAVGVSQYQMALLEGRGHEEDGARRSEEWRKREKERENDVEEREREVVRREKWVVEEMR